MRLLLATIALCTALAGASPVAAHVGAGALILVTADHVNPGEPFELVAADMGESATVQFRIERDALVVPLSSVVAGPDGHFTTSLTLPADFPTGYAELFATADDGSEASTWVLVGARTEATPPPPDQASLLTDPAFLVVLVALIGAAAAIAWLVLRPKASPLPARNTRRGGSAKRSRSGTSR